ncbi:MAG: YSC84-related protein [Pseudomonadota bacterium]
MRLHSRLLATVLLLAVTAPVLADNYSDTIENFRSALDGDFFDDAYGYAVFPTIGKGGMGIGGAHGNGRVYRQGDYIGDTKMTQLTFGLQMGGQAYSQMIFFVDERALNEFTSGNFEFGAQATAVAITASAQAAATTTGTGAGAATDEDSARAAGKYTKGMAVFTIAKGGLMYEASIGGQKFSYKDAE